MGTLAAFECSMASIVWGFTPSSAATTRITISVTFDPLALISVNAAWPGVSIKVILLLSSILILYAPICCVIPPCSPATMFVFLKASSNDVFPWSTCPITVTIGALFIKFLLFLIFRFEDLISSCFSLIGVWPNSFTKYSAVSASSVWLIVALTPIPKRCLIILLACSAIRFESSWIVILLGIFTPLTTFLIANFSFLFCDTIFSFLSLARLTEAKLLSFVSISSSDSALDIVSLYSLFWTVPLFLLAILVLNNCTSLSLHLLVALCSAIFLISKFFFGTFVTALELLFSPVFLLNTFWFLLKLSFWLKELIWFFFLDIFFSTTTDDFIPLV